MTKDQFSKICMLAHRCTPTITDHEKELLSRIECKKYLLILLRADVCINLSTDTDFVLHEAELRQKKQKG